MNSRVDDLELTVAKLRKRLEYLEGRVDELEEINTHISSVIADEVAQALEETNLYDSVVAVLKTYVDTKLAPVNERFELIEQVVTKLDADLKALTEATQEGLQSLENLANDHQVRIAALEKTVARMEFGDTVSFVWDGAQTIYDFVYGAGAMKGLFSALKDKVMTIAQRLGFGDSWLDAVDPLESKTKMFDTIAEADTRLTEYMASEMAEALVQEYAMEMVGPMIEGAFDSFFAAMGLDSLVGVGVLSGASGLLGALAGAGLTSLTLSNTVSKTELAEKLAQNLEQVAFNYPTKVYLATLMDEYSLTAEIKLWLADYVKHSELFIKLQPYALKTELSSITPFDSAVLANYYTKAQIEGKKYVTEAQIDDLTLRFDQSVDQVRVDIAADFVSKTALNEEVYSKTQCDDLFARKESIEVVRQEILDQATILYPTYSHLDINYFTSREVAEILEHYSTRDFVELFYVKKADLQKQLEDNYLTATQSYTAFSLKAGATDLTVTKMIGIYETEATATAAEYYTKAQLDSIVATLATKLQLDTDFVLKSYADAHYANTATLSEIYLTRNEAQANYATITYTATTYTTKAYAESSFTKLSYLTTYYWNKEQLGDRFDTVALRDQAIAAALYTNNQNYFTKTEVEASVYSAVLDQVQQFYYTKEACDLKFVTLSDPRLSVDPGDGTSALTMQDVVNYGYSRAEVDAKTNQIVTDLAEYAKITWVDTQFTLKTYSQEYIEQLNATTANSMQSQLGNIGTVSLWGDYRGSVADALARVVQANPLSTGELQSKIGDLSSVLMWDQPITTIADGFQKVNAVSLERIAGARDDITMNSFTIRSSGSLTTLPYQLDDLINYKQVQMYVDGRYNKLTYGWFRTGDPGNAQNNKFPIGTTNSGSLAAVDFGGFVTSVQYTQVSGQCTRFTINYPPTTDSLCYPMVVLQDLAFPAADDGVVTDINPVIVTRGLVNGQFNVTIKEASSLSDLNYKAHILLVRLNPQQLAGQLI